LAAADCIFWRCFRGTAFARAFGGSFACFAAGTSLSLSLSLPLPEPELLLPEPDPDPEPLLLLLPLPEPEPLLLEPLLLYRRGCLPP
jgi:hypothetical protein